MWEVLVNTCENKQKLREFTGYKYKLNVFVLYIDCIEF